VLTLVGEPHPGNHVRGVGQRVGVSAPSASRLLRRLEDRGLIELQRDATDRRFMRVRLTPSGEAARTKVIERRRVAVRELLRASSQELPDDVPGALSAIADTLLVSA
jgi:DNA-binding MarR family transcriptional regulator